MARMLQLRRSLLSLSKPLHQAPIAYLIPRLVGDHGRPKSGALKKQVDSWWRRVIDEMSRVLLLQRSLLSLSKPPQFQVASFFPNLVGAHGRYNTRVSNILRARVGVSTNKNSLYGFRTFCSGKDLSTKKCVPCNAQDLRPMTEESANDLIPKVNGWKLLNEGGQLKLSRSWRVKSFTKGLELFKLVADVAEAEGHHPDLHLVGWNNVTIEIWTHAVGGLTENDFILASKINKLDLQSLMRRKAATTSA